MISNRIRQVQDPVIPIVARWTAENPGTISLGQGVVHYGPPDEVMRAVSIAALQDPGLNRYGPVVGNPALIERVAEKLKRENGIDLAAENSSVVCTAGANMGFLNAVLAVADIGDEIILISPYYFNHHMAIEIAGCRAVCVPSTTDHQPDLDALQRSITARTRAIVTVSPNNPTGAVYPDDVLSAINQCCASHGIYHISDEAYEYFLHDDARHMSPAARSGAGHHTISLFSLSKAYGLAGWRIGYSVVPNHLLDGIKKIQDTNLICPTMVSQVAAAAALDVGSDWCRRQIDGLTSVRDAALATLAPLGDRCRVNTPQGAFYLFLHVQTDRSDMQIVESLIRDHRVAVLPGSAFGFDGQGQGVATTRSLRLSYGALDPQTVVAGVGRLRDGLSELL